MKKVLALLLCTLTVLFFLVGCGEKVECDFCGKVAKCSEIEVLGQTIHICKDCKNSIKNLGNFLS